MEIISVIRKNYPILVMSIKYKDLDKTKCSAKFLSHRNFDDDTLVYVKCNINGNIDYRGKRGEYRIYEVGKHEIVNIFNYGKT